MSQTFPGAHARLHHCPNPTGGGSAWTLILANEHARAMPEAMTAPGAFNALLTFDAGFRWPDGTGFELATAALEHGGVAALAFATLGDALACKRRLDEEAGR